MVQSHLLLIIIVRLVLVKRDEKLLLLMGCLGISPPLLFIIVELLGPTQIHLVLVERFLSLKAMQKTVELVSVVKSTLP